MIEHIVGVYLTIGGLLLLASLCFLNERQIAELSGWRCTLIASAVFVVAWPYFLWRIDWRK